MNPGTHDPIECYLADLHPRLAPYFAEEVADGHIREVRDHLVSALEDGQSSEEAIREFGPARRLARDLVTGCLDSKWTTAFRWSAVALSLVGIADLYWRFFLFGEFRPWLGYGGWIVSWPLVLLCAFLGKRTVLESYGIVAVTLGVSGYLIGGLTSVSYGSPERGDGTYRLVIPRSAVAETIRAADRRIHRANELITLFESAKATILASKSETDLPEWLRSSAQQPARPGNLYVTPSDFRRWFDNEVSTMYSKQSTGVVHRTQHGAFYRDLKSSWVAASPGFIRGEQALIASETALLLETAKQPFDTDCAFQCFAQTAMCAGIFFVLQILGGLLGERATLWKMRRRRRALT